MYRPERPDVGLREAVGGVAVRRPRGDRVIGRIGGLVLVHRADRDDERVVARSRRHVDRAARPEVAGRRDDGHAREPEPLNGLVERVVLEARRGRARHRDVDHLDAVRVLVGENPVARRDDVALHRLAVRVRHLDAHDRSVLGDTRIVRARAGGDPGDHRAVTLAVVGRVSRCVAGAADDALLTGRVAELPPAARQSEQKLTLPMTREPKSAVSALMPLSMNAIAGACGAGPIRARVRVDVAPER